MAIEQFIQGAVPLAADFDGRRVAAPSGSSITVTAGNLGLHEGPVFAGNAITVGLPTQPYSLLTLSSTIQLTGISMLAETKNVYIWDEIDDINDGNWTEIETFYS